MKHYLQRMAHVALDFLLPCRCVLCQDFIESAVESLTIPRVCGACWNEIQFISAPACARCAAPLVHAKNDCETCAHQTYFFDHAYAAIAYNDHAKTLITRFKHGDQTGYASLFALWMIHALARHRGCDAREDAQQYDAIIPVPLHWRRLCMRGYNQATLLAHAMVKQYPYHYRPRLLPSTLKRMRHTPSQGHQSAHDRRINMHDAFCVGQDAVADIQGKSLLLIDDVMTTGATLNACAQALKESGATRVDVLVLARAIKHI